MTQIEVDTVDTRIMLMYGVPAPDGRPVIIEENKEFPDGSQAKPLTDEEAKRRIEELKAEEQPDSIDLQISVMYGVPFPDGRVAHEIEESEATAEKENKEFPDGAEAKPLTDEEAKRRIEELKASANE